MRTLVDIPQADLVAFNEISVREKVSRAAVIREAITQFIADHRRDPLEAGFGAWAGMEEDSVDYVNRLRDEW